MKCEACERGDCDQCGMQTWCDCDCEGWDGFTTKTAEYDAEDAVSEPRWDYCFSVWPDEQSPRWNPQTYDLFQAMTVRIVMDFTERAFNDFREELVKVGLTLREIERTPHHTPETVL